MDVQLKTQTNNNNETATTTTTTTTTTKQFSRVKEDQRNKLLHPKWF